MQLVENHHESCDQLQQHTDQAEQTLHELRTNDDERTALALARAMQLNTELAQTSEDAAELAAELTVVQCDARFAAGMTG